MRHLILLSALLLVSSWAPFSGDPLQKATIISRSTRGHLNDQAALSKLSTSLPDTSRKEGLDHCILRMLGRQKHLSERNLVITRQKKVADITEGMGKDSLFFVKNSQGVCQYVVKAYADGQRLASELSACDLLSELRLKEARVPALSAIGRASTKEGRYAILAYEYLPGEPVTALMQRVGKSQSPQERIAAMELALKAVQHVGQALAEVHSAKIEIASEEAPYFVGKEERIFARVLTFLQSHPGVMAISEEKLEELFRSLQKARSGAVRCHTYAHLDPHLANWLYDEESDTLAMIDLQTLHYSVGEGGQPLASPWLDYLTVYFDLEGIGRLYGLTQAEIADLRGTFHAFYTSASKLPLPQSEELAFYPLLHWMKIVTVFDRPIATDSPSLVAQKAQMVDWASRELAKCLEDLIGDDSNGPHKEYREREATAGQRVVGL